MHTPSTGVTTHGVFKIHKSHFVCVQKRPLLLPMKIQLGSKNKCYQATPSLLFVNNINSIQTGNLRYFVQLIMDRDCDRLLFPFLCHLVMAGPFRLLTGTRKPQHPNSCPAAQHQPINQYSLGVAGETLLLF